MLGMGSGQPNRLESLRIAFRKAGEDAKGAALASDAFFPFGNSINYFIFYFANRALYLLLFAGILLHLQILLIFGEER